MKKTSAVLRILLTVLVAMSLIATAGCNATPAASAEPTAAPEATQAVATEAPSAAPAEPAKPWKIGANLALTGAIAATDAYIKEGAEVAAKEINEAGGILGRPIEFVFEDNQSNPTTAVTTGKKLAEDKDLIAVLGPSFGTFVIPTIPSYQEGKITAVTFGSSLAIVEPINSYVFKIPMSDYKVAERLVTFLADDKKIKKVAILFADDTSGEIGRSEIEKRGQAHGLEIVAQEKYATTATDMRPQLMKINASGAEAIVVWGSPAPAAIIAKNIKELGLTQIICGSHGIAGTNFLQVAGEAAEGWYFYAVAAVAYKNLPADNPYKKMIDSFAPKLAVPFDAFHGNGRDAVYMIAEAIKNAGENADRETVRTEFEKIKNYQGLLSVYDWESHDGQTEQSLIRFTVKNNEFWPD